MEPRLFSFNSPIGACSRCDGLGETFGFSPELLVNDAELSRIKYKGNYRIVLMEVETPTPKKVEDVKEVPEDGGD